jgi:tetratricopeptide (TPR) repeat protein
VGKRLEEAAEVERLLAQAVLAAPDLPDLALTQGRLFASLGRLDEAFAAYGRAFAADGDQLEALVGQCWILATAHLVGDIEGDAYPRAAEAFRKRMADRHGTPALVPLWNPAADRLRKACECVARGEFEAARSQVEGLVRDPCPPWLAAEIPVLLDALADLARAGLRGPPPFHRGMQKGRETGPFEIDHRIWKRLAFSAARPRGGRSFPAAMPETVVPHAVALRIDAGLLTESGRHQEALAKLDLALAASPEDLFTRLDRARALARLGRKEEASREYGEATRRAVELGFPPAVTGEIASLRSR